jgi:hypothetical protein
MQSGCSVDLSIPSSAEVKNGWIYTSKAPIHLHSMDKTAPLPSEKSVQEMSTKMDHADTLLSPFLSVLSAFMCFICYNPI